MLHTRTWTLALAGWVAIAGMAQTAHAGGALAKLDRMVDAFALELTGDGEADGQRLMAAAEELAAIDEAAAALPEALQDRGKLRYVDAHLRFARGLVDAPCPAELSGSQCDLYRGLLAEKAGLALVGAGLFFAAFEMGNEFKGADRKRLARLQSAAEQLAVEIEALEARVRERSPARPRPTPRPPIAVPASWSAPAGEAKDDARFALLWGNAELYRGPADAEPAQAYAFLDEHRVEFADAIYLVEVLGEDAGGRIEVRLGGYHDWERHCVGNNLAQYWVAVRVWVDADDLVDVLAEDVAVEHGDGTGVALRAGVPLIGEQAWLNGQLVPAPADAPRATLYATAEPRPGRVQGDGYLPWGTGGAIGGAPFTVRQPAFDHNDDRVVSAWSEADGGALVTFTERCGEVRFLTDTAVAARATSGLYGVLGGMMGDQPQVVLAAGTVLYWPDGRPAGQLADAHSMRPTELYGDDARCFRVPLARTLADHVTRHLDLCVRPEDAAAP